MKLINPKTKQLAKAKKQKKINFGRIVFFLALISFLSAIIYIILFSPFLRINTIEISGNKDTERSAITEKIEAQFSGKLFDLIEKNNFFLISEKKLKDNILGEFRQISAVEIEKKFPSKIIVKVAERIPSVLFCADKCFLLDENGQAYDDREDAFAKARKVGVLEFLDLSRKETWLDWYVADRKYVEYLLMLRNRLNEDVLATENKMETPSLISKDIRVQTQEGWKIYFNAYLEIEKDLEVLRAVLEKKVTAEQRKDLEYIDLRIENKVYYKFKNETESEKNRLASLEVVEESLPAVETKKDKKKDD